MTFSKLMDGVVGTGPFQFIIMALLGIPILGMANHNLLQIFTAATPSYHCRPPPNASAGLWVLPTGLNGKPELCLRFVYPPNASLPNDTHRATEPCLDGWVYNVSTESSIVTEVCPEATPLPYFQQAPHTLQLSWTESRLGLSLPRTPGRGARQAESKDLGADAHQPKGLIPSTSSPSCDGHSAKLWGIQKCTVPDPQPGGESHQLTKVPCKGM